MHTEHPGYHFDATDIAIVIFLCIFLSGAAGIIIGNYMAFSEDRAKIAACVEKNRMHCTIEAQAGP